MVALPGFVASGVKYRLPVRADSSDADRSASLLKALDLLLG